MLNNTDKLPNYVTDKMIGMEFRNFDQFRKTFWKLVADDPNLSKGFDVADVNAAKKLGKAPRVNPTQVNGKADSYQLHHIKPIHDKGGVYDLDNIVIVTPRYHKEILDKNFHRGNNGK